MFKKEPTQNPDSSPRSGKGDSPGGAAGDSSTGEERRPAICRATMESNNYATIDYVPRIFLNAGAWHSGATDFAVVCNGDIIQGSWLPGDFAEMPLPTLKKELQGNNELIAFLDAIAALEVPRGFIRQKRFVSASRDFRFTNDNDLYVFVGDCHIHLCSEWGPDGFVRDPDESETENGWSRKSLFPDFVEFIGFCNRQTDSEKIIQVGDLYDYWESQNIFEGAANVLLTLVKRCNSDWGGIGFKTFKPEILSDPGRFRIELEKVENELSWWNGTEVLPIALARYFGVDTDTSKLGTLHQLDWEYRKKWEERVNREFAQAERKPCLQDVLALLFYGIDRNNHGFCEYTMPKRFYNLGPVLNPGPEWNSVAQDRFIKEVSMLPGRKDPIDFLSYQEIESAIRGKYPASKGFWDTFEKIQGNHDMKVHNRFLEEVFVKGTSRKDAKEKLGDEGAISKQSWVDEDLTLADDEVTLKLGKNDCIVCEHGHAWDPYNNAFNFDLFDVAPVPIPVTLPDTIPVPIPVPIPIIIPGPIPVVASVIVPVSPGDNKKRLFGMDTALPGGFHTCRGWTVGDNLVFPDIGYDGDFNDAGFGASISWSEYGKTYSNAEAILALEAGNHARAVAIYESGKPHCASVRLIVMGHSHNPRIDTNHYELMNKEYHEWKTVFDQKANSKYVERIDRAVPAK